MEIEAFRAEVLEALDATVSVDWQLLSDVDRDFLKGEWLYYRPLGITDCAFGYHPIAATYLLLHHDADQYKDHDLGRERPGSLMYINLARYSMDVSQAMDILLRVAPSAFVSGASQITKGPALHDKRSGLTEQELEMLGQAFGIMDVGDFYG